MSNQLVTYSGRDLNASFTHPLVGTIQAAGVASKGIKQITVRMLVDQSNVQVGMDGAVVPSVIPGDTAEIEIQVWQTSTLHQAFLAIYNAIKAARDAADVSTWFSGTLLIANTVMGTSHYATGLAPKKLPDQTYQEQAQPYTWTFIACNCTTE